MATAVGRYGFITPGQIGPFGNLYSHAGDIAPAALATVILLLPKDHPHLLPHDDVAVLTEAAVAFVALLIAIYMTLAEYRRRAVRI